MANEQLKFDLGKLSSRQFEPVDHVVEGARRYAESKGRSVDHTGLDTMQADPALQFRVQSAYRRREGKPENNPGAAKSYGAMRSEVNDQYAHLTRPEHEGGMGFTHEVTDKDPYPSAAHMAQDVKDRHIKTFATASTGGHEFFTDEENDKFRAVHDVFGHAATGRGFTRNGEEAAYHAHAQMFPSEAKPAMAAETRGQNSHLNYAPKGGFPDQGPGSSLVTLPDWAQKDRLNKKQFGPRPRPDQRRR